MTAGEEAHKEDATSIGESFADNQTTPKEIDEIFEFLSFNDKIVFKSQQIDDPELERSEKIEIAKEIFERNRQTFLQRFGSYFEEHHLEAFGRIYHNDFNDGVNGSSDEIKEMLLEYRRRLQTRQRDVKNRRYTHMQFLIRQGDYFSELEMMNRAPELYQELIGQYLSEEEKRHRDCYDVKNTTFSGILMHTLEQKQRDEMLKEADAELEKENEQALVIEEPRKAAEDYAMQIAKNNSPSSKRATDFVVEEDEESDDVSLKNDAAPNDEYEVPQTCRQQWGNFDNESIACSTSNSKEVNSCSLKTGKNLVKKEFITAGERDLLRQEFVGLMHERFLAGKDSNFDYCLIDDNTQLDDLSLLNQDKEDAYFDDSEDDLDTITNTVRCSVSDSDTEDELDVYMRHLNQHHSLKI